MPARSRALAACAVALLALSGCGDLEQAAAAGSSRNDLAGDLASQLGGAASLTYSAVYQLRGGRPATISQGQLPTRSAYVYPGGEVIVTATATTRCAPAPKRLRCTMIAPVTLTTPEPPAVFTAAGASGMVLPETVLALLDTASLDADKTVAQHDTTIAGRHATCVDVAGVEAVEAGGFQTCITTEGLLASFTGDISGTPVDMAMTHYSDKPAPDAFNPPPTATLIDRRAP